MSTPMGAKITEHFAASIDPRVERTRLHPMLGMLVAKGSLRSDKRFIAN